MAMISTSEIGEYVNSDMVVRIKPGSDGDAVLELADGSTVRCAGSPYDVVEKFAPVIVAEPGNFLLLTDYAGSDEKFWFTKSAIIAWRIGEDNPRPVTVGGDERCDNAQAILCADGTVEIQEDRTFDNFEQWLEYANKEWAAGRARLEAKKASAT